jgi:DTW domain-containing protein
MLEHCICSGLERARNRTEIVFVRHHWEAHKSTGTVRIAELVLERSRLVEIGYDAAAADRALSTFDQAWLLYPDAAPARLPERLPARLVLLDGTWAQTRRMLRRLPSVSLLQRLVLPARETRCIELRKTHLPSGRSSIEAVADALELLEGPEVSEPVRKAARLHRESVLRARGKPLH